MTLEDLIAQCIKAKQGDKAFALFFNGELGWRAMIGNPDNVVMLGETEGEVEAEGATAIEAVSALLEAVKEWTPPLSPADEAFYYEEDVSVTEAENRRAALELIEMGSFDD